MPDYFQLIARRAQRNLAAVERGLAFRSASVGRMTSSAKADSKMANRAPTGYSIPMTALEHDILKHLIKLEALVKAMPTTDPKPNLLPLFQQIEALANQLPQGTAPDLLHYLQRKSYEKARQWLEGRYAEIQKGGCLR